jgi:hypothetical protein
MKGFRTLLLAILLAARGSLLATAVVDRIAALVDQQVITLSEVSQMSDIRFFPRPAGQNDDDYRHSILDSLISQALRYRDVERFGAEDIPKDSIEARLLEIQKRFASPADFTAAMQHAELTLDEVRTLVKRQLQVEAYIQERFAPMIIISNDEIATYYRGAWSQQRRQRGLSIPPLTEVNEEIRTLLKSTRQQEEIDKWTAQLRARANVDVYAWR